MAIQGIPRYAGKLGITIAVRDAEAAAAFYVSAFGAEVVARYLVPDHPPSVGPVKGIDLRIGEAALHLSTANPRTSETMDRWGAKTPELLRGFSTVLTLSVDDVDAALARAEAAGARRVDAPQTTFCGHRVAVIEDPFGHPWGLAADIEEVTVEEHNRRWERLAAEKGRAGTAPYLTIST